MTWLNISEGTSSTLGVQHEANWALTGSSDEVITVIIHLPT